MAETRSRREPNGVRPQSEPTDGDAVAPVENVAESAPPNIGAAAD